MWKCDRITVWMYECVFDWQCDSLAVWQFDSVTLWQYDSSVQYLWPHVSIVPLLLFPLFFTALPCTSLNHIIHYHTPPQCAKLPYNAPNNKSLRCTALYCGLRPDRKGLLGVEMTAWGHNPVGPSRQGGTGTLNIRGLNHSTALCIIHETVETVIRPSNLILYHCHSHCHRPAISTGLFLRCVWFLSLESNLQEGKSSQCNWFLSIFATPDTFSHCQLLTDPVRARELKCWENVNPPPPVRC